MNPAATSDVTFKRIGEALQPVQDPEIHISIVDLGLVYGAEMDKDGGGANVRVRMSLTSPMCPYGPMLLAMVHGAVANVENEPRQPCITDDAERRSGCA